MREPHQRFDRDRAPNQRPQQAAHRVPLSGPRSGDVLDQESLPCPVVRWDGLPAQHVARLALEHLAERGECREAHRLGAAVLEHRQIGGRDPYAVRELAHGHLPPGQHYVDVDGDRHQITSSNSACICAASTSRATAWASSIRSTSTRRATPRMATPIPPIMTVTPGSARWPGALRTVTANHTRAAATIAPITTSTYRKAASEKRTRFRVAPSSPAAIRRPGRPGPTPCPGS